MERDEMEGMDGVDECEMAVVEGRGRGGEEST